MHVDAIVNAANNSLLGGGGVDGWSSPRGGRNWCRNARFWAAARTGGCEITHGYKLPCKYVIHTVDQFGATESTEKKEKLISLLSPVACTCGGI